MAGIELLLITLLVGDLPTTITATNIAGFVILAVVLTAVPFVLWFNAIAKAGVVVVAPFFLLVPITAFVLDALIKGFVPTGMQIVGAVIVIAGLLLSQWVPKAQRKHSGKAQQVHPAKPS